MRPYYRNPSELAVELERSHKKKNLPYSKVAASDAVLYSAGTMLGHGIFVVTSFPFSAVINNALLKPPSNLSIWDMGEDTEGKDETTVQRASRSNLAYRFDSSCFSLTRNRPFVYSKSCSYWIGSPKGGYQ